MRDWLSPSGCDLPWVESHCVLPELDSRSAPWGWHWPRSGLGGGARSAVSVWTACAVWRPNFSGKLRNFAPTWGRRGRRADQLLRSGSRSDSLRGSGQGRRPKCTIAPGFGPKETPSSASFSSPAAPRPPVAGCLRSTNGWPQAELPSRIGSRLP